LKKIAFGIAAAALAASAAAQSDATVTVFGIADLNARHVKNGSLSVNQLANSGYTNNRLGFRGTEDLGGGLKAAFWLEHGMNMDTGTPGDAAKFWNRRASISLSGGFGEVRLGRFLTAQYLGYGNFDPFGDAGLGAAGNFTTVLGSGALTKVRADNMVSYLLPSNLGGAYGQFDVSAGENAVGNKHHGGILGYKNGPLDVAGAFGSTEVTGGKYKVATLGASYAFPAVTLIGNLHQVKYTANNKKFARALLGAKVPLGQHELRGSISVGNASGGGTDNNDARMVALGYAYHMSKRTVLYATAAQISNKGAAAFVVATVPPAVAGQKSSGFEGGIRHAF
jgi:predicted porin